MKMTYKGWVLGPGSTVSVKLDCKVTWPCPHPARAPDRAPIANRR